MRLLKARDEPSGAGMEDKVPMEILVVVVYGLGFDTADFGYTQTVISPSLVFWTL